MAMQMKAKRDVIFSCLVEEREREVTERDEEIWGRREEESDPERERDREGDYNLSKKKKKKIKD